MTLTEFLLARIAEDEAPTWTLVPYQCKPGCCAPVGWVGSKCRFCDPAPVYGGTVAAITQLAQEHAEDVHEWSRRLAECEAKRRIVERCGPIADDPTLPSTHLARHVLQDLAVVYTGHPDYDEAWRL